MTHFSKDAEATEIVRRLRDGQFGDDELDAMLNRISDLFDDHDVDSLHVPEDAGEYRPGIVALVMRIPEGWGRWISCEAGWYPLITELGTMLAEMDPDYVVHQIKEKFGTLRFYAESDLVGDERERFDALIDEAEVRSACICERCGNGDADLCVSGTALYSHAKTLCRACCILLQAAGDEDYRPIAAWESLD
jgi:hypothetical protein